MLNQEVWDLMITTGSTSHTCTTQGKGRLEREALGCKAKGNSSPPQDKSSCQVRRSHLDLKRVLTGLEFCSHLHMSNGDLQDRVIWVIISADWGRALASTLPSQGPSVPLPLPLCSLLLPLHFPKEALKPDTSVERSGGLFKITARLCWCLLSKGGRGMKRD